MKKLGTVEMEAVSGGICRIPPTDNPNFPLACLNGCLIASMMSNGNHAFICLE